MGLLVAAMTALTLATPSVAVATPDPPPWMGVTCAGGVLTVVTTPARTITATGCLVAHPGSGGRLACAAVGPPEGSGLPPAVPMSVDDPIVRRLPVPGASPLMDTFCGTCV
jgi:hypothetical protein